MAKTILLLIVLVIAATLLIGCNTAKGLKGDVTFIGDKTAEVLDQ